VPLCLGEEKERVWSLKIPSHTAEVGEVPRAVAAEIADALLAFILEAAKHNVDATTLTYGFSCDTKKKAAESLGRFSY
jgi:hypothetical protein